jgi:hypothetical protein
MRLQRRCVEKVRLLVKSHEYMDPWVRAEPPNNSIVNDGPVHDAAGSTDRRECKGGLIDLVTLATEIHWGVCKRATITALLKCQTALGGVLPKRPSALAGIWCWRP